MGCKKYDAKNEKNTFPLFFFILSLYSYNFLYCSSTGLLLFIYCYYSIRTIYFKLNGSFYTREGVKVY